MRKILRWLSALVLFFSVWLLWPRELDGFMAGRDGRLAVPDYAMTNARYVSVKGGKVEMESISQEAYFDLHAREMHAKNVTAYFYNQVQEKTQVKADRANYHLDHRRIRLIDNVTSLSPDGFLLRGPEAEYYLDARKLVAPQPVEGEQPERELKIWGNRAESYLDKRTVELTGDARAQFVEKRRGLTKVRGDRALMERDKEVLTFSQNVRVNQGTTVATSNIGHIFYAPKERGVRYMSLLEDVRIDESNGRYTRSQVAEFFAPTDTIVLSRFPSVYHGDDVVTGDRITLYRTTGVVEVTATNAAGSAEGLGKQPGKKPALTEEDKELIP